MTRSDPEPYLDLVIAAHDPRRRVDRAISSVLAASDEARVRLTVVAHGVAAGDFSAAIRDHDGDPRLRIVELDDGIRSPAGPYNHGLSLATAEYVGLLGSDDFLEPGTVDAWVAHAREHRPDYLMASLRTQGGPVWREPLIRPRRRVRLDPVRDRINYRTAPLGMIRRDFLTRTGILLTPGMPTGEDIELGLAVNNLGRVDSALGLPCYVIGTDAPQRVTFEQRSFAQEIAPVRRLAQVPWLQDLAERRRGAIGIKLWRMSLLTGVTRRRLREQWHDDDLEALRDVTRWLSEFAPRATRCLSRAEAPIVIAATDPSPERLLAATDEFMAAGRAQWAVTADWRYSLAVDSRMRRLLRMRLPA